MSPFSLPSRLAVICAFSTAVYRITFDSKLMKTNVGVKDKQFSWCQLVIFPFTTSLGESRKLFPMQQLREATRVAFTLNSL
jgi:hypothetical protein